MSSPNSDPRVKMWQRLISTKTALHISSVRIIESEVFRPQEISFGRITAITGPHGSGKTLLLRSIESAFGYAEYSDIPPLVRLSTGSSEESFVTGVIEVSVQSHRGVISRQIDLGWTPDERRDAWPWDEFELEGDENDSPWWPEYVSPIIAFSQVAMLHNSGMPRPFDKVKEYSHEEASASDLRAFKSILGREYAAVSTYSVHSLIFEEHATPFIIATLADGRQVNSMQFSTAELWVHYLLWFLGRANRGSTVLIDEPETSISGRGHRPLADELGRRALARDLQLIIATHAEGFLSRMPLDNIILSSGRPGTTALAPPSSIVQLRDAVGIATRIRAVALVEDSLAQRMLRALLAGFDLQLAREVDVVAANGAAEVRAGVRALHQSIRIPHFGVLDGDQMDRANASDDHGILYLPGASTPERELLSLSKEDLSALAIRLDRSASDIERAVLDLEHLDHQYQVSNVASRLGQTEEAVVEALIALWLARPGIKESARIMIERITEMLRTAD